MTQPAAAPLAPLQIGALVACALNAITENREHKCCPDCCNSCNTLRELDRAGTLDRAVWPFIQATGEWHWWSGVQVDRDWLYARWAPCTDCGET